MSDRSPYWDYTEFDPIRVQFQTGTVDIDNLQAYLDEQTRGLEASLAAGERYYLVIVADFERRTPPEVRKLQAEWLDRHRAMIAEHALGMSFVVPNKLVRGALTAIFWISRPPVSYRVHPDLAEALAHAVAVCQKHGLELPAAALWPDAAQRALLARERIFGPRAVAH